MWRRSGVLTAAVGNEPYRLAGALSLMEPATQGTGGGGGGGGGGPDDGGLDHIAIDASGFIGGALRMLKAEGPRKDYDAARIVVQNIAGLLRRFQPGKSVAVLLDGPEPLWVAARARSSGARRAELRSARLPGGALATAVEEQLLEALPDRRIAPPEVVFSGSLAPGLAEHKAAAWLQSVAARHPGDSVALAGSNELVLSAIASPIPRTAVLVQNNAEYKTVARPQLLRWLGLSDAAAAAAAAASAQPAALSAARGPRPLPAEVDALRRRCADVTLLQILGGGLAAAAVPAVANASLPDLLDAYHAVCVADGRFLLRRSDVLLPAVPSPSGLERDPAAAVAAYNALDLPLLAAVLDRVPVKAAGPPAFDAVCGDYLTLALEAQRMLCYGHIANPQFAPRAAPGSNGQPAPYPASPKVTTLIAHVRAAAAQSPTHEPLPGGGFTTAAEYTVLNTTSGPVAKQAITAFVGHAVDDAVAAAIAANASPAGALQDVRSVLRFANPRNPHAALCHAPSLCLVEQPLGGRSSWRMFPVDLFPAPRPPLPTAEHPAAAPTTPPPRPAV